MVPSPAHRCLDILEALADAPDGAALSAIGERLGLPKSAAHRFLTLLEQRGYVRKDSVSQRYRLTFKLPALGFRFIASIRLPEVCQPVLDALAARTGELARIAVVDGERMTWVAKAQGALHGLRYDPDTGHDVVLHATASGKAWLATLPESRALATAQPLIRKAPNTATDVAALRERLREARRNGYAEAVEEGAPGIAAVAAVVRAAPDPDAPVVATVSVAGPLARFDASRRRELAALVIGAARELEEVWPIRTHAAPLVTRSEASHA
jgi:DNA-binding IclR family transcriptional regulator